MYSSNYIGVSGILIKFVDKKVYPLVFCSFKNAKNGTTIFESQDKLFPFDMEEWEIGQLCGGN